MKVLVGIICGIAVVVLLLFGYNEHQKYKIITKINNSINLTPATSHHKDKGISPSDFEIKSFNPRWEDGRLRAIGEIKNNGKISGGPHVEVIARDEKGELIALKIFGQIASPISTLGELVVLNTRLLKTVEQSQPI